MHRCPLQTHKCAQLTPEVLRELDAGRSRGERGPPTEGVPAQTQAKVGTHVAEDPRDLAPLVMMEDE